METPSSKERPEGSEGTRNVQPWASAHDEYARLQQSLASAQADAYSQTSERLANAQKEYVSNLSNLNEELKGRYREAHATFTAKLQEAMSRAAGAPDTDAYTAFMQSLAVLHDEFQKRAAQYLNALGSAAEQAGRDYQFSNRNAYRKYLEAQRDFWTKLDVDALMPRE